MSEKSFTIKEYYDSICSIVKAGAVVLERPSAVVQRDRRTHATRNMSASQAVKRFKTSAVDVPNKDSLASPPKEEPKPELLLSCIRITAHKITQTIMKRAIVKKYRNAMVLFPTLIDFLNVYHSLFEEKFQEKVMPLRLTIHRHQVGLVDPERLKG